MEFKEFKKIPRLSRDIIVTEKIDGSNGQICITDFSMDEDYCDRVFIDNETTSITLNSLGYDFVNNFCLGKKQLSEYHYLYMFAGSRNRWLQIGKQTDNMAFATWVKENAEQLFELGKGCHYGEWYGKGIQRGYGLEEKRFALFNVSKWQNKNLPLVDEKQKYPPSCCEVVPILYEGEFCTETINVVLGFLIVAGSRAVPGYMNPEGIVVFHTASGQYFKKTILNDEKPKGVTNGN